LVEHVIILAKSEKKLDIPARVLILHEIHDDLAIENHRSWTFKQCGMPEQVSAYNRPAK